MIFSSFSYIKKGILCFIILGFAIIYSVETASAQKIKSQVNLMLERLPLDKQQKLKDFAEDIETYLNDYNWTEEPSDDEIPISIQIFLMDQSVSYEDRYSGTFLISNNSDIQYFDKYWRFPYQAGDPLEHNENVFHPFNGFLDFYVYLIIGGEYDKFGKFLGTPYFEKAKLISEQAKFNSQFILGWEERTELVDKILSNENKPFRMMKDLFFLGLSYVGEEDTTAQKYCVNALSILEQILTENPEEKEALQLLQAHYIELIDVFQDNQEILKKLAKLDPEHAETYQQYIED